MASNVFGLTWAVLNCKEQTTVDDFGCGILVKDEAEDDYFNSKSEASNVKACHLCLMYDVQRLTISSVRVALWLAKAA